MRVGRELASLPGRKLTVPTACVNLHYFGMLDAVTKRPVGAEAAQGGS